MQCLVSLANLSFQSKSEMRHLETIYLSLTIYNIQYVSKCYNQTIPPHFKSSKGFRRNFKHLQALNKHKQHLYIYICTYKKKNIYIYIYRIYTTYTHLPALSIFKPLRFPRNHSEAFGQGKRLPCRGGNGSALLRIEGAGEGGGGSGL